MECRRLRLAVASWGVCASVAARELPSTATTLRFLFPCDSDGDTLKFHPLIYIHQCMLCSLMFIALFISTYF